MTMLHRLLLSRAARRVFVATMAVGAILITGASVAYFDPDDLHPFVLEKLPLPLEDVWLTALHVHVVAAALSLPACLLLISRTFLRRCPGAHRIVGRVAGAVMVLALVPTGAWLAFFAKGGWPSTTGFLASGAIVAVAMVRAVIAARAKDYAAHRRFVLHVVAQMSVAVTSRAMLVGLDLVGFDADAAYLVALWLPVVGSAWAAEFLAAQPAAIARRMHALPVVPRVRHVPAHELRGVGRAA